MTMLYYKGFKAHHTASVDRPHNIGEGTTIWHYSHVMAGAKIGNCCNIGQNVFVAGGAVIGNNVKIQNNVSVYEGVTIEDDVFLGPSCVLTNITNPRSEINRKSEYKKTLIKKGATVGANATILPGVTIGRYAFIAAGAVVTHNVDDFTLVVGVPTRRVSWMTREGDRTDYQPKG